MRFINLVSIFFGIILIITGSIMMYKNFKPKLAFFIVLAGLIFIIGSAVDPDATIPHYIMRFLHLHK